MELPGTVTRLSDQAFTGCTALTGVTHSQQGGAELQPPGQRLRLCGLRQSDAVPGEPEEPQAVRPGRGALPPGRKKDQFWSAGPSAQGVVAVPNDVTEIGQEAFVNCTGLTEITLPDGMTSIDMMAFQGCTSLKRIKFPVGLKSMGYHTFENCTALEELAIPEGIAFFDFSSVLGCTSLKRIPTAGDGEKRLFLFER